MPAFMDPSYGPQPKKGEPGWDPGKGSGGGMNPTDPIAPPGSGGGTGYGGLSQDDLDRIGHRGRYAPTDDKYVPGLRPDHLDGGGNATGALDPVTGRRLGDQGQPPPGGGGPKLFETGRGPVESSLGGGRGGQTKYPGGGGFKEGGRNPFLGGDFMKILQQLFGGRGGGMGQPRGGRGRGGMPPWMQGGRGSRNVDDPRPPWMQGGGGGRRRGGGGGWDQQGERGIDLDQWEEAMANRSESGGWNG